MKFSDWRKWCVVTVAIYTLLALPGFYGAAFGRVPNDSGMIVFLSAFPTNILFTELVDYSALRSNVASLMHYRVDDRFAMVFDACTGWMLGVVQYGAIAIAAYCVIQGTAPKNVGEADHDPRR